MGNIFGDGELNKLPLHLFIDSGSNFMPTRRTNPFNQWKTGPVNPSIASLNCFRVNCIWTPEQPQIRALSSVNYSYEHNINQQCGPAVSMTCLVDFLQQTKPLAGYNNQSAGLGPATANGIADVVSVSCLGTRQEILLAAYGTCIYPMTVDQICN